MILMNFLSLFPKLKWQHKILEAVWLCRIMVIDVLLQIILTLIWLFKTLWLLIWLTAPIQSIFMMKEHKERMVMLFVHKGWGIISPSQKAQPFHWTCLIIVWDKTNLIALWCFVLCCHYYSTKKLFVCTSYLAIATWLLTEWLLGWKILFEESKCFIHLSLWNHVIRSTLLMHVSWIILEMIAIISLGGAACWQNTSRDFHMDSHMVTFLVWKWFSHLLAPL